MSWLLLAIFAYILLAGVAMGDKILLSGPVPDAKVYSFYVGFLGLLVFLAVPFLGFPIPPFPYLVGALAAGGIFLVAQFLLFSGLRLFEASRIVPAVGGLVPLVTLLVSFMIFPGVRLAAGEWTAFAFLVSGSILLTAREPRKIFSPSLLLAALSSFFFGVAFVLAKFAYLGQSFWSGFLWMRIGGGLVAAILLFSPQVRKELAAAFGRKKTRKRGTAAGLFLGNQAMGALAVILQSKAVQLVPVAGLAFVNALQGVQYVFLVLLTTVASILHPRARYHEYVSGTAIAQKAAGIALIGAGLMLLSGYGV